MTEEGNVNELDDLPEAVVDHQRRISPIWLIPVAAVVVAGFLFWQTFTDQGSTIHITFPDAAGVEAGKTTLRYRDVVVGSVTDLVVSKDLSQVIVTATLHRDANAFRVEGTRFWIERPRFGPQGISGVMTLLSGSYIGVDPGSLDGKRQKSFKGLQKPPLNLRLERGLRLMVDVREYTTGIKYGSPVLHRGIQVGRVSSLDFAADGDHVVAEIFIEDEFAKYVNSRSRFWNASGLHMDASLAGVHVELDSLEALVVGGIAFGTPGSNGEPSKDGDRFSLFKNQRRAMKKYQESQGLHVILESYSRGFVKEGDPVLYRGEKVGRVLHHRLHDDSRKIGIELQIFSRFAELVREGSKFWNSSGISTDVGFTGIHIHVSSLESLLEGSISFATPDPPGELAEPQDKFILYKRPEDKWTKWSPEIQLDPDTGEGDGPKSGSMLQ